MRNKSLVYEKAFNFAKNIVLLYKELSENKEFVLSRQLLKSGTSIGANIAEANGGISKQDFSAKMSVAYKESLETKYWLDLLKETNYISNMTHKPLYDQVDEISKIIFAILKSTGRVNN